MLLLKHEDSTSLLYKGRLEIRFTGFALVIDVENETFAVRPMDVGLSKPHRSALPSESAKERESDASKRNKAKPQQSARSKRQVAPPNTPGELPTRQREALEAIGAGNHRFSEIAGKLGISSSRTAAVLNSLRLKKLVMRRSRRYYLTKEGKRLLNGETGT